MQEKLLPNIYKKIALTAGVLTLIALILKDPIAKALDFHEVRLDRIIKDLFLISLLAVVFSKEQNESEAISILRLKKLKEAVGFGGFILLFNSVQEIVFWDGDYEMKNGYEIMIGILIFYLVVFHIKKNQLKKTV